ncbi:hypothetical protein L1049_003713 [Liquidambar formosana]|uniref:FAF domain-containing protein n=1 Tax=Liquidambar formosana TaxID=63359 RepID=A0AAP0WV19_LIQFO
MSSSVCQGLQSCLEPGRLTEPLVLRLKLAPPQSNSPRSAGWAGKTSVSTNDTEEPGEKSHIEENNTTTNNSSNENKKNKNIIDENGDLGGWSFIQSLTNTSDNSKEEVENEKVYVHPMVKRSSSMLSKKSLEMCTESLGCETGSDISESSDDIRSLSSETTSFLAREERSKMREIYMAKKLNPSRSFPPPLTSISGSGGVQVRPHREGGRLVLKAVAVTPCKTYFHAERGDGRLRLRLFKDNSLDFDNLATEEEEKISEKDVENGVDDDVEAEDEAAAAAEDEEEQEQEEEEEELIDYYDDDDDDDDDDEEEDSVFRGEMDGNRQNVGGEIEIEKLPRPSRCKEGGHRNKGLWNLEACNLVATS